MAAPLTLALLLCGSIGVKATPARAVGGGGRVTLEVTAAAPDGEALSGARLSVTTNLGQVSPAEELAPGRFRATFTPPREAYPQVALIHLALEHGGQLETAWLPLPVDGAETLHLETSKRGATVEVTIAGRTFGPVPANQRGVADVRVLVPPGVSSAEVRSVDRVGNQRVKTVDLAPPPFPRVRIVAPGAPAASWADPEPLPLEVFALDGAGAPASAPPELRADRGTLSAPRPSGQPGAFTATFRAPDRVPPQPVARLGPVPASPAELLQLPLLPGPPARVQVRAEPARYRAGSGEPVRLWAWVEDEKGNLASAGEPPRFSAGLGAVEPAGADRATLALPDQFGGRAAAVVAARAGGASGEASIALEAGPAAAGKLSPPSLALRAGDPPLEVVVALEDRFGNPVSGARLQLRATRGQAELDGEAGPGAYRLRLSAGEGEAAGEGRLEVRVPQSEVAISAQLSIHPGAASRGLSAGLLGQGHSNLAGLHGGGALLEVALRPLPRVPLELVLQAGGSGFLPLLDQNDGVLVEARAWTFSAALGPRYSVALRPGLSAHGAVLLGPLWSVASYRLTAQGTATDQRWWDGGGTFLLRAGAGFTLRLGPGRALGELQLSYARAPGNTGLSGNLGGAALVAGYLLDLW